MMRMNIDDGDIFIGEFANGGIGSIQTSFVTVGNYPGIEARVYGSKGALICRLVEERGICESLKAATKDAVEFEPLEVPQRFYPTGGSARESWRSLFYANLTHSFISEIRGDVEGNEGNFEDGAHVQELINADEASPEYDEMDDEAKDLLADLREQQQMMAEGLIDPINGLDDYRLVLGDGDGGK
jgi:predicted dehydrogenase